MKLDYGKYYLFLLQQLYYLIQPKQYQQREKYKPEHESE